MSGAAADAFLDEPRTAAALERAEAMRQREYSDLVDQEGRQYVDLVLEGGGVLGIALVGYTTVLERAGLRFLGVAGTSAGAINAMLLAAAGSSDQAKSDRILSILAGLDMDRFMDGGRAERAFVRSFFQRSGLLRKLWLGLRVLGPFLERLGLHPGDWFEEWLRRELAELGVRDTAGLKERLGPAMPLRRRGASEDEGELGAALKLITAEVRTETKVEFPAMAPLFFEHPDEVDPARYVRASMSIPYFFHPHRVGPIPQGVAAKRRWEDLVRYRGDLPRECVFVDGGIVSNFPIHVFHRTDRVPRRPTFGVRLGRSRDRLQAADGLGDLSLAIFNTARHNLDFDFFLRHPDYEKLVAAIDTGSHNWLDFQMDRGAQVDLFARGAQAAAEFLERFDWPAYRTFRARAVAS